MAKNDWRSFAFFDLRPDADGGRLAAALQAATITSTAAGCQRICVGDSAGRVHVFDRNWAALTFQAHRGGAVTHCQLAHGASATSSSIAPPNAAAALTPLPQPAAAAHQPPLLVTIGPADDANPLQPQLCCWNLARLTAASVDAGTFACVRTARLAARPRSLAIADNGQCIAVGYEHGGIQLFRCDATGSMAATGGGAFRGWSTSAGRSAAQPMEAQELKCGTAPIVGLAFKLAHRTLQLFVCAERQVAVFVLPAGERVKETLVVLDKLDDGRQMRCSWMQRPEQTLGGGGTMAERHFMCAQDDAVYCYNGDGRGPCYALKGVKHSVHWFRSHLVTVYESGDSQHLTVIDIQNNVIGYEERCDGPVAAVCLEFGSAYVLYADRRVQHLDERDFRTKLDLLFKQGLYDTGVRIAKNNQYDDEGLAEIFKRYGDHLAKRGKHQEAVEQYIKTIGHLEPSYVIRAFLDPRHIDYLVEYLKAVHARGHATANLTTLLLNCFTRLNTGDQLQQFLHVTANTGAHNPAVTGATAADTFDVDVAIGVCRSSAADCALQLARRHRRHAAYLAILVEDRQAYAEALAYLRRLPFAACVENARAFGTVLMQHCGDEMTELLAALCTWYAPTTTTTDAEDDSATVELLADAAADTVPTTNGGGVGDEQSDSNQLNPSSFGQRADAVSMMHLFVGHADRQLRFLERVAAELGADQLPASIGNALIELYAQRWHSQRAVGGGANNAAADAAAARIMELLRALATTTNGVGGSDGGGGGGADYSQALVLCRMQQFWPGVLYIYEELGMAHLVVQHHLRHGEYAALLQSCQRLGVRQPAVWFQALAGLKSDAACPPALMAQILERIAFGKHRSPLQVLDCLAVDGGPTLDAVRDYFGQQLGRDYAQLRRDEEAAAARAAEVRAQRAQIEALRERPVEFRGTTCQVCRQPLTMPAVYFMCSCCFHQDCLQVPTDGGGGGSGAGADGSAPAQCPVCAQKPASQQLANALRSQLESRTQHDQFHDLLQRDPDPFGVVADYFRRGMFGGCGGDASDELPAMDARGAGLKINKNRHDPPPTESAVAAAVGAPKTQASKALAYGPGAEAGVRTLEAQHMRQEEAIRRLPLPEARMRLQEAAGSGGKTAKVAAGSAAVPAFRAPQKQTTAGVTARSGGQTHSRGATAKPQQQHPADRAYDPTKNPFGENGDDDEDAAREATTLNPFGDCDDDDDGVGGGAAVVRKPLDRNLNPFE